MALTTKDIQTLEFPINVQKRVNMYLGASAKNDKTPGAKNVAIREIIDNCVTEAMKGHADKIEITFQKDGTIIIEDNGRGLPIDKDKETGKNGIEKTLAELHSGGNFNNDGKVSGPGLNGVGGSCVNAVSKEFKVDVFRNGRQYTEVFENGYVVEPLHSVKCDDKPL